MASRLSFIDSIKGLAIIFVLLLHSLSAEVLNAIYGTAHIGQAVPIFLAVTFYLSYMTMDRLDGELIQWYGGNRIKKMLKRVVLPFSVVLIIQCIILLFFTDTQFVTILIGGGYGPGSYYIWMYLQIWVLAPFLYKLLRWQSYLGACVVLVVCVLLNVICSNICPEFIWRLLCVRYLFLSVIAWIWYKWDEISMKHKTVFAILGLASLGYLLFYSNKDLTPFIYYGNWNSENYPVFFWTLCLIIFLVWLLSRAHPKQISLLNWFGQNSWEIFLAQMFIIGFINGFPQIINPTITAVLYVAFCFVTSIGCVFIYTRINQKKSIRNTQTEESNNI